MALQLGALRDALKAAGVSDQLAREAAEEVAAYENQLIGVRSEIVGLRGDVDQQGTALRADIAALKAYVDQQGAALRADIAGLRAYVDQQLTVLRAYVDQQVAALRGEIALLRAEIASLRRETRLMNGILLALVIAILVKLFVHG